VPHPDLTRRHALTGVAVGGLTLPLLAACGSGSSSSTGAQPPSGPSSLVPKSQVPVGGGVILRAQNIVVTQPSRGTFEGFNATCTHQGCQLASVSAGTINCGCHGSQFSIKDGSNVAGPSGTPAGSVAALGRVPIKVKGADIVEG
jgi:nitrite reductase/ring-hydroxylating ferredoxin subunit